MPRENDNDYQQFFIAGGEMGINISFVVLAEIRKLNKLRSLTARNDLFDYKITSNCSFSKKHTCTLITGLFKSSETGSYISKNQRIQ